MFVAFAKHIEKNGLFVAGDELLLALSGGLDSVVLAHLLKKQGVVFSLAHCNFKLRGQDSDDDETFCKNLAKDLGVKFYSQHFDVPAYCAQHKVSVQMAARELRYTWFKELMHETGASYLVTAHHADDNLETLLINLLHGTGIKGLKGIPEKSGYILRPLLPFGKEDLLAYATENKLSYRTDKSNSDEKYERNYLRLNVLPALKKLKPGLESTILKNINNFKEEADIVKDYLEQRITHLTEQKGDQLYIDKKSLEEDKYRRSILHSLLEPKGFNSSQVNDILDNITGGGLVGKLFNSTTHALTIDRDWLIIKQLSADSFSEISIESIEELNEKNLLSVEHLSDFTNPAPYELVLDSNKLVFPLRIRKSTRGDKFKPFGMKGFKLLSDFFKDEKLNKFEKENCNLLVNGNGEIIWVMGIRNDERYRVEPGVKNLIKLTLIG